MEEERELGRLLQELQRQDEASAPSFRDVLRRPDRVRSNALPQRLALGVLTVSVLAAMGVIFLIRRPAPEGRPPVPETISEWKSPTDSLLRTPGWELLDSIPSIGERLPEFSWIEEGKLEATPSIRKGNVPNR